MSKIFSSNDWDNHVALVINLPVDQALVQQINNGAFNYLNDSAIELTVNQMQKMFGEELTVIKMQTFKTPLTEVQLTSLIGYHQYALIQTQTKNQKIYWSTEKNGDRIWLTAYDSFEKCRDYAPTLQKRYKKQYWKPIEVKKATQPQNSDFYDIVRWIYQEARNKKDYSWFKNSSKSFISHLFTKFK